MNEQPQSPRQVAEKEAVKQAVGLAFTLVAVGIMVWVQRKSTPVNPLDSAGMARRRMEIAQQAARRWDRIAAYCFRTDMVRLAGMAHQRAEAARAAYERERP